MSDSSESDLDPQASGNETSDVISDPLSLEKQDLTTMSMEELKQLKQQLRGIVSGSNSSSNFIPRFKKESKNRPREVSSKKPEKRDTPKDKSFDPRFNENCGQLNESKFRQNYKFLDEMREEEVKQVRKKVKKTKDPEKKQLLVKLEQRMTNQERSLKDREEEQAIRQELIHKEKERSGTPYVNKSQITSAKLVKQFLALKKSGKLDRYMEKKRKRQAGQQKKKLNL